jgi:hypothetical protein
MSTTKTGIRTARRDSLDYFTPFSNVELAKKSSRSLDRGWVLVKKSRNHTKVYLLSAEEFGEMLAAGGKAVLIAGAPATFKDEQTDEYPVTSDHWIDFEKGNEV